MIPAEIVAEARRRQRARIMAEVRAVLVVANHVDRDVTTALVGVLDDLDVLPDDEVAWRAPQTAAMLQDVVTWLPCANEVAA